MFTAPGQPAQQQNKTFFVGSGDLDTPKINQAFKGTPSRRSFFVLHNRKKTIISRRGELRSPAFCKLCSYTFCKLSYYTIQLPIPIKRENTVLPYGVALRFYNDLNVFSQGTVSTPTRFFRNAEDGVLYAKRKALGIFRGLANCFMYLSVIDKLVVFVVPAVKLTNLCANRL